MSRRAALLALTACTFTITLSGCGDTDPTTTIAPSPAPGAKETRDPLPGRPAGWSPYVNERGGFALLLPRGWKPDGQGPRALIRSYDRLVAISISPSRTPAAQAIGLGEFATRTATALGGYRGEPELGAPRPFHHHYDGVRVNGRATSDEGVAEHLSVIVLRRDDLVTVTIVLAANAKPAARYSQRLANRAIATLRSRPTAP